MPRPPFRRAGRSHVRPVGSRGPSALKAARGLAVWVTPDAGQDIDPDVLVRAARTAAGTCPEDCSGGGSPSGLPPELPRPPSGPHRPERRLGRAAPAGAAAAPRRRRRPSRRTPRDGRRRRLPSRDRPASRRLGSRPAGPVSLVAVDLAAGRGPAGRQPGEPDRRRIQGSCATSWRTVPGPSAARSCSFPRIVRKSPAAASRSIDVYVGRVRRKLGNAPARHRHGPRRRLPVRPRPLRNRPRTRGILHLRPSPSPKARSARIDRQTTPRIIMSHTLTTKLQPGTQAPDFTLPDAEGKPISLADYRGKNVIVYFYPKAATPGCTTEACDFRDSLASLQGSGYEVLGISPDAPRSPGRLHRRLRADLPAALRRGPRRGTGLRRLGRKAASTAKSSKASSAPPWCSTPRARSMLAQYQVKAQGHVAALEGSPGRLAPTLSHLPAAFYRNALSLNAASASASR